MSSEIHKHIEKSLKPDSLIFVIPKELEIKWSIKRIISLTLNIIVKKLPLREINIAKINCSTIPERTNLQFIFLLSEDNK